jgi:transcriptional regulator with XRE-family HTH domain/DNA-binding CsgD family transcriptional regulator
MRRQRGWTAQQLAERCALEGQPSLTRSNIAKIESGARRTVTTDEALGLARALEVSLDDLLISDQHADALTDALGQLYDDAGQPDFNDIGSRLGLTVRAVAEIFHGTMVPSARILDLLVGLLGEDPQPFHRLRSRIVVERKSHVSAGSTSPDYHVLAGLVSSDAQDLFSTLQVRGAVPLGDGSGEVPVSAPAIQELLATGAAIQVAGLPPLLRAVPLAQALQSILQYRHTETSQLLRQVDQLQNGLLHGWERLSEALLAPTSELAPTGLDGIEMITDLPRIARLAAELWHTAKGQLRGTETGRFPSVPTRSPRTLLPTKQGNFPVQFRMVYQYSYTNTPIGRRIVAASIGAGEESRMHPAVPVKMLHVDDRVALVGIDEAARAALLIKSPQLLAVLTTWFEALWLQSVPFDARATITLNDIQHRILQQMAAGQSDEQIARRLNLSLTTIRRNIKGIYSHLDVTNRFAAGAEAARRRLI